MVIVNTAQSAPWPAAATVIRKKLTRAHHPHPRPGVRDAESYPRERYDSRAELCFQRPEKAPRAGSYISIYNRTLARKVPTYGIGSGAEFALLMRNGTRPT